MNPWDLVLVLLGWVAVAIVVLILILIVVAGVMAVVGMLRQRGRKPDKSRTIFKSPAE